MPEYGTQFYNPMTGQAGAWQPAQYDPQPVWLPSPSYLPEPEPEAEPSETGSRPKKEYSRADLYSAWRNIYTDPEFEKLDQEERLNTLRRFDAAIREMHGANPDGLDTLVESQILVLTGQEAPDELGFLDSWTEERRFRSLGTRASTTFTETGAKELLGHLDARYEAMVQEGGRDAPSGWISGIGGTLGALAEEAGGGASAGAATGAAYGALAKGVGAAPGAVIGMGYGALAGGAAGQGIRSQGEALESNYFANRDAGMDRFEAFDKAARSAAISGLINMGLMALDPTKVTGRLLQTGGQQIVRETGKQLAVRETGKQIAGGTGKQAARTGVGRFAVEQGTRFGVAGGINAAGEVVDVGQMRLLGNVDASRFRGTLGQRMLTAGAVGGAFHTAAPVLGKAFRTAKVLGGKDFRGKSWGAKYNAVFAEENLLGAMGQIQRMKEEGEAGVRGQGAPDLDTMQRVREVETPDDAVQVLTKIWDDITDGTEPVKFSVVDDATGSKLVMDDVDAQYNRAAQTVEAYLNVFRWDKETGQRVTLLHESAHAFMDTLPVDVVAGLHKVYEAEMMNLSGPLHRLDAEGNVVRRGNVHPDVDISFREWFAEHMAIANDGWAKTKRTDAARRDRATARVEKERADSSKAAEKKKKKADEKKTLTEKLEERLEGKKEEATAKETLPKGKATVAGVFDKLSAHFRGKLDKVGRRLGLKPEGLHAAFRDFMDSGDAYMYGRDDKGLDTRGLLEQMVAGHQLDRQLAVAMAYAGSTRDLGMPRAGKLPRELETVLKRGTADDPVMREFFEVYDRHAEMSKKSLPTTADLEKAAEWAAISTVEGHKRGRHTVGTVDAPEAAPRLSDAEIAKAQKRVEEIDTKLATKTKDGGPSRKERKALRGERKQLMEDIGERYLEKERKPRRMDPEREGLARDAREFADDPEGYKDRYEPGGEDRLKVAREAREDVAKTMRRRELERKAEERAEKKRAKERKAEDKELAKKGYREDEKTGQLEFDTREKPKTVQETVARKLERDEEVTPADLEAMRAEIEAETKAKVEAKRKSEPRLKGEDEEGRLGDIGRDDSGVEYSRRGGRPTKMSREVSQAIADAELPKGPVEAAAKFAEAEQVASTRTMDEFFGQVWPKLLRRTGKQQGSKKEASIVAAADQAIADMEGFIRDNPDYLNFYNKDWALTRRHLDAFVEEEFGHRVSDDEFAMYRMLNGLTSASTALKANTGDAVNLFHLWMQERTFSSFELGPKPGTGAIVVLGGPFQVSGKTANLKMRSIQAVEELVKRHDGDVLKAVEFLQEPVPARELHAFNREMGYKGNVGKIGDIRRLVKAATGQDEMIPRMFIFGEKVGAYTLNALGDHRYSTIDIWESRLIRSQFKGMFKKNYGLPENVNEHALFSRFTEIFHQRFEEVTGRKWERSALQAIRWFYYIDAARRAGYKPASTNESISGYTREKLDGLRERGAEGGRRGDEAIGRGDEGGQVRPEGVEFSRRGATGSLVYSAELIPGKNTGLMPHLFDAPYEVRRAFNEEMKAAFADPATGRDIIAEEMGLRSRGIAQSGSEPSLYFNSGGDPEINPSIRVPFQASQADVELYAALHGYFSKQEMVAGFRPLYHSDPGAEVGYRVTGRSLTEGEVVTLGRVAVEVLGESNAKEVGFFNRHDGFEVVDFSFGKLTQQDMKGLLTGLREANLMVQDVKRFGLAEEGIYHEHNWRKDPTGGSYQDLIGRHSDRFSEPGRPDLHRRVDSRISPQLGRVSERWSEGVPADVEFSRRGGDDGLEGAPARRFPDRAASSPGASADLKPIRESRPDIATYEPQHLTDHIAGMEGRNDAVLWEGVRRLETLERVSDENFDVADALALMDRKRGELRKAVDPEVARRLEDDVERIFASLSKAGTSIGQMLNQYRLFKGVRAQDKVALLNNYLLNRGRKLTDDQKKTFRKLVQKDEDALVAYETAKERALESFDEPDIRKAIEAEDKVEATFLDVQKFARTMLPRESIAADWRAVVSGGLLTGVSLMRNFWGNYVNFIPETGSRAIATPVDMAISKLRGTEREVGLAPVAEVVGFGRESWRAMKKLPKKAMHGATGDKVVGETMRSFNPVRSLVQAFTGDLPVDAATGKVRKRDRVAKLAEAVFGAGPEVMLRGLTVMDDLAKAGARGIRRAEAISNKKLEKGTKEHTEAMLGLDREIKAMEDEFALERTFQEDSAAANMALAPERSLRASLGEAGVTGWRVLTSPYIKTPVNLAAQTMSYAFPPLAVAEGIYHGAKGNRRKAELAAGKFAVGVTLGAMADWLLEDDIISGGPDASKKMNTMRSGGGMGFFQINLNGFKRKWNGGDGRYQLGDETWRLDTLGVMGGVFAVHAETKRRKLRHQDKGVNEHPWDKHVDVNALASVTSLGRFMMDQTMLRGVSLGLDALRHGDPNTAMGNIVNAWGLTPAPLWNNTFTQYRAAQWDYKPDLRSKDGAIATIADLVQYKMGNYENLPLKRDIWGRPIEQTPDGQNRYVYHLLDIRKPQRVRDRARVRLQQLFDQTQDSDLIPSLPNETITLPNGEQMRLPSRLYESYVAEVQGAKLYAFERIVSDPRWYRMQPDAAIGYMKRIRDTYGREAMKRWKYRHGAELYREWLALLKQRAE